MDWLSVITKQMVVIRVVVRMMFCACMPVISCGCCALYLASAPYNRDLSSVKPGTDRADVIAGYGEPDSTTYRNGKEVDSYETDPTGPKGPGEKAILVLGGFLFDGMTLGLMDLAIGEIALLDHLTKPSEESPSVPASSQYPGCFVYLVHYSVGEKVESVDTASQ